jgi:PKD repeat protein
MLNQNPIHSNFSYNVVGANVQFNANCYNASNLFWNFGDGDTSSANNPEHFYASNGSFPVQLIATNECYSDTLTLSVDINSSSTINYYQPEQWFLYPSPSNGIVRLNTPELVGELYQVVDLYGAIIQKGIITQTEFDFSQWPKGVYFLKIANGSQKIILQ